MTIPDTVESGYQAISDRVQNACRAANRNIADVKIVAVSKTIPADRVHLAIDSGATILGESYIQEARDKTAILSHLPVSWHFIGHLQSNKAKYAVRLFDLIHSVDSLKLAREIDLQAAKIDKVQDILIQVNISGEESKSGISADSVESLIRDIAPLENTRIKGLMTLPPFFDDPDKARPFFASLHELFSTLNNARIPKVEMTELSMGMSGDFEAAIAEGATLVRVGTAIFGARQ